MAARDPQDEVGALARAVRARVEYDAALAVDGYPRAERRAKRRPAEATALRSAPPESGDLFVTSAVQHARSLPALCEVIGDCRRCKLAPHRTNLVFGVGNPKARLVFVGEAPGADEDAKGEPFVGRAGQLLTEIITKGMGLRREDVYIANVIKCRPPGNRNPEPDEVASCEPFLIRQLELIGPEVIVALGKFAAQTLLRTKTPIAKLRGQWADYHGIKLMPTFHPAYLLRNPGDKRLVWSDIKAVLAVLGLPVPSR
ncbi:MAG TPA: uracil-DNA glycosylase [Candidatus Limnocylindria bacterium]|nr:uracil-DNA glycosylase [Candidatus Limnocylindria bacterium]